jgi:hypothetical protein
MNNEHVLIALIIVAGIIILLDTNSTVSSGTKDTMIVLGVLLGLGAIGFIAVKAL